MFKGVGCRSLEGYPFFLTSLNHAPPGMGRLGRRCCVQVTFPKTVNSIWTKSRPSPSGPLLYTVYVNLSLTNRAYSSPAYHRPNATKPVLFCCVCSAANNRQLSVAAELTHTGPRAHKIPVVVALGLASPPSQPGQIHDTITGPVCQLPRPSGGPVWPGGAFCFLAACLPLHRSRSPTRCCD